MLISIMFMVGCSYQDKDNLTLNGKCNYITAENYCEELGFTFVGGYHTVSSFKFDCLTKCGIQNFKISGNNNCNIIELIDIKENKFKKDCKETYIEHFVKVGEEYYYEFTKCKDNDIIIDVNIIKNRLGVKKNE